MKKLKVGYLFNGSPGKDEKLFNKLSGKKNIKLIMINTSKDLNEEEIEKIAEACDIFYNNSAENISYEVVKTLEELGKRVIESSESLYYEEDKWMSFLKCAQHSIPTLRTILLSQNVNIAKKELKEFGSWPIVLKGVEGSNGEYVERAENPKQAEEIIKKFWKKGSEKIPIIAQEFVDSPSFRVTIIGDKITQTAIKNSTGWKKTGNHSNHIEKFEIERELKDIIKKLSKAFKLSIWGIDFLKKDGKWLVLEVNAQPGFDFFEEERERLISEVLDFLKEKIKT